MRRCSRLAAVALLLASACTSSRTVTNVGMQKDQTDIVYGYTARSKAGAAPVVPPAARPAGAAAAAPTFPPFDTSRFASGNEGSGLCPSAPGGAPIAKAAGTDVEGRPSPGKYKWTASGHVEIGGAKAPLVGIHFAYVRPPRPYVSVFQPSGADFTFDSIYPRQNVPFVRITWTVRPAPPSAQDPEGGLAIRKVEFLGVDGKPRGTYFEASGPGLLVMPFPVKAGQSWSSFAIDLDRGGRALQLNGRVGKREIVDACGTVLQGWHVHATLTQPDGTATLDYLVAPQYGGQVISWKADGFFFADVFRNAVMHVGQLEPDPLPDKFR